MDESQRRKRKPIDKNAAFAEFKNEGEGKKIENTIIECRQDMKDKKQTIKTLS